MYLLFPCFLVCFFVDAFLLAFGLGGGVCEREGVIVCVCVCVCMRMHCITTISLLSPEPFNINLKWASSHLRFHYKNFKLSTQLAYTHYDTPTTEVDAKND